MQPRSRALAAFAGVAVVVLAVLVLVGRWERDHHADEENRGIREIARAVDRVRLLGSLRQPSLSAYRVSVGFGFDCLLWRRGANRFALELCFDRQGRVIEAIDRRGAGDPRIFSVREEPELSTVRVERRVVDRLLRRLGAPGF